MCVRCWCAFRCSQTDRALPLGRAIRVVIMYAHHESYRCSYSHRWLGQSSEWPLDAICSQRFLFSNCTHSVYMCRGHCAAHSIDCRLPPPSLFTEPFVFSFATIIYGMRAVLPLLIIVVNYNKSVYVIIAFKYGERCVLHLRFCKLISVSGLIKFAWIY